MSKENEMIWMALNWAYDVNGTQGALDLADAMEIGNERECDGCEVSTPHFDDSCVVCGTHNPLNK